MVNTFITCNFLHKFLVTNVNMFNLSHKWVLLRRPFQQSNTRALNHWRELEILRNAFRSRIANFGFHMIAQSQLIAGDRRWSQTIAGDRTWFYLSRSSVIAIAGSQTIAEVCFHMIADNRRRYCHLRSYGNQPFNRHVSVQQCWTRWQNKCNIENDVLFSNDTGKLGKEKFRVLLSGVELKTFRLLVRMLYHWATGDSWELRH